MSIHEKDRWLKGIPGAIPRQAKARPPKIKSTMPESKIQEEVNNFLDDQGAPYIHMPEEMLEAIFTHPHLDIQQKRRIASYIRGIPDDLIFHPDIRIGKYCLVLPLELKKETGKLTHRQEDWLHTIGTTVTYNLGEAIDSIMEFLNLRIKNND